MMRWLRCHRIGKGELVVLRPDKFVFGAGADGAKLTRALRDQLGLAAHRSAVAAKAL